MRDAVKRLIARAARTTAGKHALHAATRPEVRAERFPEVANWPEQVGGFHDLAFLFTSSQLNHGVASLRFDEAAFLYRLVSSLGTARLAEIGRFKGGSTFVTASAMAEGSTLHSYDLHAPGLGLDGAQLDRELAAGLERYGLEDGVHLLVGDSRTILLPESGLDLLFVDGDHTYEGASTDLERWSPLVRVGGHLVAHDAVDTGGYGNTYSGVRQAVAELVERGGFERLADAGTMAHLRRHAP